MTGPSRSMPGPGDPQEGPGGGAPRLCRQPEQPGRAVSRRRRDERAEPLYRQALEILKKVLGEGHPDYANSLNNLAELYRAMGDERACSRSDRQALEITKKALGKGHPDYANSLNNLAELYDEWLRPGLQPLCESLEITKKALGEGHPKYATSLNNLATLYHAMARMSGPSRSWPGPGDLQEDPGGGAPRLCQQPEQLGRAV